MWKIFSILTPFFFILSSVHFLLGGKSFKTTALAFLMSLLVLISLKFSKKYNISVIAVFIIGTAINQYTMYTALNVERIVDLLWMLSVSVFVFYMFGSRYGIGSMAINFVGLIGAILYVPKEVIIETIQNQTLNVELAHIINIIVSTVITGYFIKKIIEYSNYNEEKLKEANIDLLQQRDEKIVMLQEIHHRVKNNLQIVSSLLRLQSSQLDNEEMVTQFREAINRVSSMALIHEKMYQTDDLSNVDIKNYLNSLIKDIIRTYSFKSHISIDIQSNIYNFSLDSLVPLALIFNELITNSIKHAFNESSDGKITILIQKESESKTTITYKDNGQGFNEIPTENFGSVLIETFSEQLDGEYSIKDTKGIGVEYYFVFKNLK
ncbi:MAG: sensor histidine kinase [Flavobacteriales bacterium]|nr:sensor histidine kinase [Flavobacteriales bacterium]